MPFESGSGHQGSGDWVQNGQTVQNIGKRLSGGTVLLQRFPPRPHILSRVFFEHEQCGLAQGSVHRQGAPIKSPAMMQGVSFSYSSASVLCTALNPQSRSDSSFADLIGVVSRRKVFTRDTHAGTSVALLRIGKTIDSGVRTTIGTVIILSRVLHDVL